MGISSNLEDSIVEGCDPIHQENRFGIPQSITTDQGTMFTRDEMTYFAKDYGIQLIKSTPFYSQANGQAKSSNRVLINILENMLEDNPRD